MYVPTKRVEHDPITKFSETTAVLATEIVLEADH